MRPMRKSNRLRQIGALVILSPMRLQEKDRCIVGGLAKIYAGMSAAVAVVLAVGYGQWLALPLWALAWLLTIVGGRLLGKAIRGSRRRSPYPLIATVVTWLLLVVVVFFGGAAVAMVIEQGVR